jgi:serine protease Do
VRSGTRPSEEQLALSDNGQEQGDEGGSGAARPGAISPKVLGMSLAPLDAGARQRYSLAPTVHGVVIESVAQDSQAAQTGLSKGDVIARAGERAAVTPADVAAAVAEAKAAGRKGVFLLVTHDGRNIGLTVKFDMK